jgi:hypothetical protein
MQNWRTSVSAALLNILIGLITSVISGTAVWLWQHGKNAHALRRKVAFFGLKSGSECLIVMGSVPDRPRASSHDDIHALLGVGALAAEAGCPVSVHFPQELRESNGSRTEFCIGGPDSNSRTRAHLTSNLPGISFRPYNPSRRDSIAIVAGRQHMVRNPRNTEYAVAAKFTPQGSSAPVILICGQTAVTNRAAISFLASKYRSVEKMVTSTEKFCVIIRVTAVEAYGHEAAVLDRDVTAVAFGKSAPKDPN